MVDEELSGGVEDLGGGGGGNLKTIIIIAAIALIMGVGGFFAGKMLSGGKDEEKKPAIEQKTDTKTDQENKTNDGGEQNSQDNNGDSGNDGDQSMTKAKRGILVLDPFTVNLNDPFGRRYIEVVFNLVVDKRELVPKIKQNELLMPKIRHEIFMTVSAKSYGELKSTSGKVTLYEEIMMRVNEILKEEMGIEPVIEVLQTKFLIQ
jgi:flagellar basal body-associated protein FliL